MAEVMKGARDATPMSDNSPRMRTNRGRDDTNVFI